MPLRFFELVPGALFSMSSPSPDALDRDDVSINAETLPLFERADKVESQVQVQPSRKRMVSLDMLRGFVLFWMCLVDEQGDLTLGPYANVYWAFREHEWNGIAPADLIFPMFLFMMGTSIVLAMRSKSIFERSVWIPVFRRTVILIVLGMLLKLLETKFNFLNFDIMGVLQRIGLCYGVVVFVYGVAPVYVQRIIIISFLIIYSLFMYAYPVPDSYHMDGNQTVFEKCGRAIVTPWCSTATYFDRSVFGPHHMTYPTLNEGFISTLTAIATTYAGCEFARLWLSLPREKKLFWEYGRSSFLLWCGGSVGMILSSIPFNFIVPYNKPIWSLSFVLLTSGLGGVLMLLFYMFYDSPFEVPGRSWITTATLPLTWLGRNTLFFYLLMTAVDTIMINLIPVKLHGKEVSLWHFMYTVVWQGLVHDPFFASSLMAFAHLVVWTLLCFFLHYKKWFLTL